ncbi:hypothetical protein [Pontibacter brevis]
MGVFLAYVWVRPFGPIYWGVAFFPLLFIGLLFALLLAAATPPRHGTTYTRKEYDTLDRKAEESPEDDKAVLGIFFWTAIILFISLRLPVYL